MTAGARIGNRRDGSVRLLGRRKNGVCEVVAVVAGRKSRSASISSPWLAQSDQKHHLA